MSSKIADIENDAAKLDIHNRKYFLSSFALSYALSGLVMWSAELAGMDIKYWWPLFASAPISIAAWIAATLAKKRYENLKSKLEKKSNGLMRAHYIAVRANGVARIFIWLPCSFLLYPIVLPIFHIKLSTYLAICLAIIFTWSSQAGDKKAIRQTGYTPKPKV